MNSPALAGQHQHPMAQPGFGRNPHITNNRLRLKKKFPYFEILRLPGCRLVKKNAYRER
jgi:hypothetical protein